MKYPSFTIKYKTTIVTFYLSIFIYLFSENSISMNTENLINKVVSITLKSKAYFQGSSLIFQMTGVI
jgi:hypothetical protein